MQKPTFGQEECDDGGLDAFDGCDANCKATLR